MSSSQIHDLELTETGGRGKVLVNAFDIAVVRSTSAGSELVMKNVHVAMAGGEYTRGPWCFSLQVKESVVEIKKMREAIGRSSVPALACDWL